MIKTIKNSKDSEVEITELMKPINSNFSGKIHGGYILNLMDQIAFACASKYSGKYCVTASVNTVDFLNPVNVGDFLTLKARVNYVGNTSMTVGIRVESENIQSGKKTHCNSSYFVMVAKNEDGSNAEVPKLHLYESEDVRRFIRSKSRLETNKLRKKTYSQESFDYKEHLDELKKYNVHIDPKLLD
ncbi:acyl-CoA thioesterase [Wenyingzhuangia sp. 2_MG-2023]|uniref:acyl-CoA thioesterase n=1 Tax=Wenyingzhuangia sp. 2_MG-2023 TaxID=3062639 RepID=UPI0026E460CD|nr:acyl-CoA thioesterase [Wenyingzhuangia sp. 2_MG-2023]MDO6738442.1 acyl-CoA thioesterase [Wenyingzhuangia sp. 2_MG-2023]MDO6803335.1 acyl-CoA thioesterase [Wenyingzhuangia sp. 1_MG-2023]